MIIVKELKFLLTTVKNPFLNLTINFSYIKDKGQGTNITVNKNIISGMANESPNIRTFSWYKNELTALIRMKGMNIFWKVKERIFQEKLEFQDHISMHLVDSTR